VTANPSSGARGRPADTPELGVCGPCSQRAPRPLPRAVAPAPLATTPRVRPQRLSPREQREDESVITRLCARQLGALERRVPGEHALLRPPRGRGASLSAASRGSGSQLRSRRPYRSRVARRSAPSTHRLSLARAATSRATPSPGERPVSARCLRACAGRLPDTFAYEDSSDAYRSGWRGVMRCRV
jgi:hypothetical protein